MSKQKSLEIKHSTDIDRQHVRATIDLGNLVLVLPRAVQSEEDMGDYEWNTLKALQTDEGLNLVLSAIANQPFSEINLPIGEHWYTTASAKKINGILHFFLYYGAN